MAETAPQLPQSFDAGKAMSLSMGMASPLWLAFAGAATAGAAFWWMSRWTNPTHLETLFALPDAAPSAVEPEAVVEQAAAIVEPAAEIAVTAMETAADVAASETAALVEGLADVDPVVEPAAAVAADAPVAAAMDDLTRLVGVGPKLAVALADRGISGFADIAAWTADDLAKVDVELSLKGRAVRDAWVAQAKRFLEA